MDESAPIPGGNVRLTPLLGDFRLLLILYISFRLILMMVYQPIIVNDVERGISAGGDRYYHYQLAALSGQGKLPFRDWWSEFPPVWYLTTTAIYQLFGDRVSYPSWSMALSLIVLAFDVGTLVLVRSIGAQLHGRNTGMTLAWVYAVTVAPLVFIWWNFEALVAFFLLLGIWWLLSGRETRSAAAVAAGALTKFTPALTLGAVWRFREWRTALRYSLISLAVFVLFYGLLLVNNPNPQIALASLTAQFGKASYQTVWALIDGNYETGNFGSVESHLDPAQASAIQGSPAVVPSWLRLAVAGGIGLAVFARVRRIDDRGLVAFVAITVLIFFLQAQGWSPQWLVQIVPLVLLVFPTRNGVLTVVMLSLLSFAEYPFLFIRTGDSGGVITGALVIPFVALVLARTAILIGLCFGIYQQLRQEPVRSA